MRELAVLGEALTVVGEHSDDSVASRRFLSNCVHKPADLLVSIRNFAIIGPAVVRLFERARRLVGHVWIVEVDPQKIRSSRLRVEPVKCPINSIAAAPLRLFAELFFFAL